MRWCETSSVSITSNHHNLSALHMASRSTKLALAAYRGYKEVDTENTMDRNTDWHLANAKQNVRQTVKCGFLLMNMRINVLLESQQCRTSRSTTFGIQQLHL